jgi:protease IV
MRNAMSNSPQPAGQVPQRPAAAQAAPPGVYYFYPVPPPRGFLWRFFRTIFFLAIGFFLLSLVLAPFAVLMTGDAASRIQEKFVSYDEKATDKIVILPIEGIITESEDGFVKRAIDKAKQDKDVKAIVLRVDSPGGTVTGSDYIYHHLRKLADEKDVPIVVSMGGMAASGGYYVSMAVGHEPNTIFAERTGLTGSIGVLIPHYNLTATMEKLGVVDDSIASHPLKEMLSPTKSMTPEEKKIVQELVKDDFEKFKEVVRAGREAFAKDPKKLDALATGQVFTVDQAVKNGLVDKAGYIEDAVERAIELAHMKGGKFKVVRYKDEPKLSSLLLGEQSKSPPLDVKALLDATTPRAYYLATWLPSLAGAVK